jgi:hypothetical protein
VGGEGGAPVPLEISVEAKECATSRQSRRAACCAHRGALRARWEAKNGEQAEGEPQEEARAIADVHGAEAGGGRGMSISTTPKVRRA